jgi:hypothetical protein
MLSTAKEKPPEALARDRGPNRPAFAWADRPADGFGLFASYFLTSHAANVSLGTL